MGSSQRDLRVCAQGRTLQERVAGCTRLLNRRLPSRLRAEIFNARGNAYKNMGGLSRAIAAYNEALRRRPDIGAIYAGRAAIWQEKATSVAR